jgi:hypothetical protein
MDLVNGDIKPGIIGIKPLSCGLTEPKSKERKNN